MNTPEKLNTLDALTRVSDAAAFALAQCVRKTPAAADFIRSLPECRPVLEAFEKSRADVVAFIKKVKS